MPAPLGCEEERVDTRIRPENRFHWVPRNSDNRDHNSPIENIVSKSLSGVSARQLFNRLNERNCVFHRCFFVDAVAQIENVPVQSFNRCQ